MLILNDIKKTQTQCSLWEAEGETIVLVPTMGFFHAGHEKLMQKAKNSGTKVVVSLFVNPTQFGPNEDLTSYPRDLAKDTAIAEKNGVDLLFIPNVEGMYPAGYATWVEVPELSDKLCGKNRPGHFKGVCSVVLKLFMISKAHVAVFGQKDWQQLTILRRMARDLNLTLKISSMPTVRENDGLALSSRNTYLTREERVMAPHIQCSLHLAKNIIDAGEKNAECVKEKIREYWRENIPQCKEDYLEIVSPDSLESLTEITGNALIATAIRLGKTRLIDNLLV